MLSKNLNRHRVCQHIVPRMLNEDQSKNEVKNTSQAELNDMAENGFQKYFDDLSKPWQKCVVTQGDLSGCGSLVIIMETQKKLKLNHLAHRPRIPFRGCGSAPVKVSDHGRHVKSSSPVPLKTRRVGQRCTLNLSSAETSSRWCGVVVRRGGASSGVVHVT
ncbi:uncharacterized protein TNCV_1375201 [Trichonephila clavipes]|nr:uncharacterized protein TNCV_1375201 [Trichonephila clavipes]